MLCAPKTVFTAGLMLTALSGAAQALTVTQDQVMTQNGQNFTFTYSGLPASDGTGGTVTISRLDATTAQAVVDISASQGAPVAASIRSLRSRFP